MMSLLFYYAYFIMPSFFEEAFLLVMQISRRGIRLGYRTPSGLPRTQSSHCRDAFSPEMHPPCFAALAVDLFWGRLYY